MVGWAPRRPKQHKDCRGVAVAGAPEPLVAGTAEDGRAVAGIPEALVLGTTEGPRLEIPEALTETVEQQPAVTETPEAVDMGIPDGPTSGVVAADCRLKLEL